MVGGGGKKYVVMIVSMFIFILINNLISLIPYSYAITSQIIITFVMSLSIFLGVTFTGFHLHGLHFLKLFVPQGLPLPILPFIFLIELISYFFRIISLSVRLAANITTGHILFKILSSLGLKLSSFSFLFIFFPLAIVFCIFFLEIFVSIIQAYVFTILSLSYIKDSLSGH
jgi:ATP synthase subunit 6